MSRIGKLPISIPSGVAVSVDDGLVKVAGSKGNLQTPLLNGISVDVNDSIVLVSRQNDLAVNRANHGLIRSLVNNMIIGVSQGYEKKLEIVGVGYRVAAQGTDLKFNLGFSHDVIYKLPEGVTAELEQNIITLRCIDKQKLGQVAAEIRALKKPEPYKGKGIKYVGEQILRKSGKSGKEAA
jgi:large subunit ribosomal protein L6